MKIVRWLGIGLVVSFVVASMVIIVPGFAAGLRPPASSSNDLPASGVSWLGSSSSRYLGVQPNWNDGNLCVASEDGSISYHGHGDITCSSLISKANVPLWWNFSEVPSGVEHGTVTVAILGGSDCINLNFNSANTTIVIDLFGSGYSCPASGGDPSPGINVVVNSTGDSFNVNQQGNSYLTNVTSYGTTTFTSNVMGGSNDNTTFTYIGWSATTETCPSGVTAGAVTWSEVAFGSHDTFNTIFVDQKHIHHAPPNHPYSTEPLGSPDGFAYGVDDFYGSETTQSTPAGACYYLGV